MTDLAFYALVAVLLLIWLCIILLTVDLIRGLLDDLSPSLMSETLFLSFVLILIVAAISVTVVIKFMHWYHLLIDYLERRY